MSILAWLRSNFLQAPDPGAVPPAPWLLRLLVLLLLAHQVHSDGHVTPCWLQLVWAFALCDTIMRAGQ